MAHVKREIVYIPVRNLSVVWTQCQRPYKEAWAKHIADNFDPDLFEPIIVTKPNGHGIYHIVEGQHRRHALEMYAAKVSATGNGSSEQAPCQVVDEADPARAAEIWLGVNKGRKAVQPIHGFKVAVTANWKDEVEINRLVIQHGYRIEANKTTDCVTAVSALKSVYVVHGKATLNNVLKALRYLWNGDPSSVSSSMIKGFGVFLNEFGTYVDLKRLDAKMQKKFSSPHKLLTAARAHKDMTQQTLPEAMSELILREYNAGLKDKLRRKG